MKLVFFGTGEFAVPALRALASDVDLVVTQPDRPSGRGMKMHQSPVRVAADELRLPVASPERARSPEFVERVAALDADALVVASYGQILSQSLLDSAKFGGINLHGSILPAYRGAAPIQRCLLNGDTVTGVTIMQMDRGMDTGDIIEIEQLDIDPDETSGELQIRLAALAARMAGSWLPRIVLGDAARVPQDHERATLAPKVEKAEAELRVTRSFREEYNRFRAFTPSPGAWIKTDFGLVKVSKCQLIETESEPGLILDGGTLGFVDGGLRLVEVQPDGKKRMSGTDFFNGLRLKVGDRLVAVP